MTRISTVSSGRAGSDPLSSDTGAKERSDDDGTGGCVPPHIVGASIG